MYPNMPAGYPDINYSNGYGNDASQVYAGQYHTSAPPGYGGGADYVTPEQWDQYIQTLKQTYQASSGFAREQLASQIRDADEGRKNSLKIAQLQADNSRYGVDQQRQTAIDQLKQADSQFAQRHALDVRNSDISEAQLIEQERSQPNRLFQSMDLEQALGSIRSGQRATTLKMPTGVAALDSLSTDYTGNPYLARDHGSVAYPADASGSPGMSTNPVGSSSGTDPRVKAARSVMDALPPSATTGLDPTGVAALNAVFSLYHAPLRPGTLESLSPTQQGTLQSGSQRLQRYTGKSYGDLTNEYQNQAPRSLGVRAA